MHSKTRNIILLALICALIGWWLGHRMRAPAPAKHLTEAKPSTHSSRYRPLVPKKTILPLEESSSSEDQFPDGTTVEVFASTQPDELILRFPSDETFNSFVSAVRMSEVRLVNKEDRLRAIRVSFDQFTDLDALLMEENVTHYTSLPNFPSPPAHQAAQKGLLGFSNQAPAWLGVPPNHTQWGQGIRIAIVDGGVVDQPGIPKISAFIDTTSEADHPSPPVDHGTAVASLIAGSNPQAPGISPAATLISIRVVDSTQRSDSLAFASGLLAAADQRAQLVNVSMGTTEDNPMIREAVEILQQSGAVIIAASGNSGVEEAAYPAAYPGVISVGAVDAHGSQVEFSNYADMLSLTAPGYGVNALSADGKYVRMSGTSASAPFVTGAIAATMSTSPTTLTARQAADLVLSYTDEAGIPGPDTQYGSGILNIGRVMRRNQLGMVDAAITYQSFQPSTSQLSVTVQNRGTKTLINSLLETTALGGVNRMNIDALSPNEVRTFTLPIAPGRQSPFQVLTTLFTGSNGADITPENNTSSAVFKTE